MEGRLKEEKIIISRRQKKKEGEKKYKQSVAAEHVAARIGAKTHGVKALSTVAGDSEGDLRAASVVVGTSSKYTVLQPNERGKNKMQYENSYVIVVYRTVSAGSSKGRCSVIAR